MKVSQFSIKVRSVDATGKAYTRTYNDIKDDLGYKVVGDGDSDTALVFDNWARALSGISSNTYNGQASIVGTANVSEVFTE